MHTFDFIVDRHAFHGHLRFGQTDHVKRTFDYDPFIKECIRRLHQEGLLNALLDRDQYGRKNRNKKAAALTTK